MKYPLLIFLALLLCLSFRDTTSRLQGVNQKAQWVDSIYKKMSLDERIGQLVMIRAHSDKGPEHIEEVERLIKNYKVGGVCFFQGKITDQKRLTDRYQKLSSFPLLVAQDAEWGLGMRLSDAIDFPWHMTLGALQDNSLIYKVSAAMARQLKDIGVHINFAPVADVNNNPDNPVIHNRSFGESRENVAVKSYMFMLGHADEGVLSCAKHFPGHGDTDMDSHYDLPALTHPQSRIDSLELYPFRLLADQQIPAMMIAHLQMPIYEPDGKTPTSLSKKVVHDILREGYNYDGLIFTDGLEMEGVRKHFTDSEIAVQSILAGNDMLLLPQIPEVAINALKTAFFKGTLSKERLAQSVKRVLRAKYDAGLDEPPVPSPKGINTRHHHPSNYALISAVAEQAITVLDNEEKSLPIQQIVGAKIAHVSVCKSANSRTVFLDYLRGYTSVRSFKIHKNSPKSAVDALTKDLKKYDQVIVSFDDMSRKPSKQFGISSQGRQLLLNLKEEGITCTSILFGSPYALQYLPEYGAKIVAYENDDIYKQKAAEAIFGVFITRGVLPVSIGEYKRGDGEQTNSLKRLGYDLPETVFLHSDSLAKIDLLVDTLLQNRATPGCQILVARNNKIVYHRSFGHHTPYHKIPVGNDHIYDLASITKVASATLSIMRLYDEGKIDLHAPLKTYLPEVDTTELAYLKLYDILAHHAGLKSWIPFYAETLTAGKNPRPSPDYYRKEKEPGFTLKINDRLFLMDSYPDSIFNKIISTPVRENKSYVYSDLGMYLVAEIVYRITGERLDDYAQKQFYGPLGCTRTGYNPLNRFKKEEIVPSEKDQYWRKTLVHGTVHDMGAAMQHGVSGHAGLFSTTGDLAIIFQMILNKGYYGGRQYLRPETVELFTKRHPKSQRRGLGWDMKQLDTTKTLNVCPEASPYMFGHLGFTGTAAWADPEEDLIFIFLSNRTYPTMKNSVLHRENYRPRLQSLVYKSLFSYREDATQ